MSALRSSKWSSAGLPTKPLKTFCVFRLLYIGLQFLHSWLFALLTHSMEQRPSWKANRFSTSQEIPPHFIEPEGSLPQSQVPATCPYPEPARSSPYPHIPLPEDPSYHHPPIYDRVSKVVLSLRFPHQNPVFTSPLPHSRYIPSPFYRSRFCHPNNIGREVQIIGSVTGKVLAKLSTLWPYSHCN